MTDGGAGNPASSSSTEASLEAARASASLVLRFARTIAPGLAGEVPLEPILEETRVLFGAKSVHLYARTDGELRLLGSVGLPPDLALRRSHLPLDAPVLEARAIQTGEAQVASIAPRTGEVLEWTDELLHALGTPIEAAIPVAVNGIQTVLSLTRAELPTAEEGAALATFAELFAHGIRSRRLRDVSAGELGMVAELERIRQEIERCRTVETELRESEERFRLTVDEAPIGVGIVSLTGRYLRVNKVLAEILGYSVDELVGMRWQDLTHPADLEEDLVLVDRLQRGEIPRYQMEKRYIRKDGSEVMALLSVSVARDEQGAPWYFISSVQDITERRRIERELIEREKKFRAIFDSALDAMVILDGNGVFVDANAASSQMFGVSRERLVGHRFDEYRKSVLDLDADGAWDTLHEKGQVRGLFRLRMNDGSIRDFEFTARASILPHRHLFVTRDVTEREEVQRALRKREAQLAQAQAIAHLGHWQWNPRTGDIQASAEAFRIYGLTPGERELSTRFFRESLHPADRRWVRAALWRAANTRGSFSFDHRIVVPDGSVRTVHLEGAAATGDDGGVRVLGVIRDITEQRRAEDQREEALRELAGERRWLLTLIERSPVAFILVEGEGENVVFNRRAQELIAGGEGKATLEEMKHATCYPDGSPMPLDRIPSRRALRGEWVIAEEVALCRKDGTVIPALVSAGPIEDEAGNRLGAVVVIEDIRPLKELERMREEWTSVVAHDLRQPVTVISTQAQMLARKLGEENPELSSKVEHILSSSKQMNRMIGDLLDFSRIEARRLTLDRQQVQLPGLVRAVAERMADELRGHEVIVEAPAGLPLLSADPLRLEQVLTNLLSNAVKYGKPDAPVRVSVEASPGEMAVSVINEGKGIAPEELPQIFARFHRARGARESKVAGLGLGLYITRGIIEAHGGRITAASEPGRLTTFRFTLPLS